jgi:hypothetical protein
LFVAPIHASEVAEVDIKVWYLACLVTKFVWNFAVYYGKNEEIERVAHVAWKKLRLTYIIVLDLEGEIFHSLWSLDIHISKN